jgi:hypothetical protein
LALVDLERKAVERLARQLIPHLVASDIVTAEVKDLDNVEQWRKAARLVGRQLGYPVRTTLSRDGETGVCHPGAAHKAR